MQKTIFNLLFDCDYCTNDTGHVLEIWYGQRYKSTYMIIQQITNMAVLHNLRHPRNSTLPSLLFPADLTQIIQNCYVPIPYSYGYVQKLGCYRQVQVQRHTY